MTFSLPLTALQPIGRAMSQIDARAFYWAFVWAFWTHAPALLLSYMVFIARWRIAPPDDLFWLCYALAALVAVGLGWLRTRDLSLAAGAMGLVALMEVPLGLYMWSVIFNW